MSVVYVTATELRTELAVNSTVLPDAAAEKIIQSAEDQIDGLLGARAVNTTSGRKVVQTAVEAWQWSKLKRATLLLAAALYSDPDLLNRREYDRVRGPDFEFWGAKSGPLPQAVLTVLSQCGLMRLTTGMARSSTRFRLGYPSNADPVYDD